MLLTVSAVGPMYTLDKLIDSTYGTLSKAVRTVKTDTKYTPKTIIKTTLKERISKTLAPEIDEVLDFTPKFHEVREVKAPTKVTYLEVKNKEVAIEKNITSKVIAAKQVDSVVKNETVIDPNVYELSYKDIEIDTNENRDVETAVVQKVAWAKISFPSEVTREYSNKLIANKKKSTEDRISTIASAVTPETSNSTNTKNESLSSSDELVFFDLTEDGKVNTKEVIVDDEVMVEESPRVSIIDQGISKGSLSVSYDESPAPVKLNTHSAERNTNIADQPVKTYRSYKKSKPVKLSMNSVSSPVNKIANIDYAKNLKDFKNKKEGKSTLPSIEEIKNLYTQEINGQSLTSEQPKKDSDVNFGCLDSSKNKSRVLSSEYSVIANSINLGKKDIEPIHNFEIRFQDDVDDIVQDFGEGQINLNFKLNSEMNIRRGVVYAYGHYPTSHDFVFEGISARYAIPVFEKDKFDSIVERLQVPALGAQLLVELDDRTEDVELDIDTKYDGKVYLSENLNIVDRADSDYSYILFLGVNPGNTIINFKDVDNNITNKIIYLSAKEIYYEPNFYANIKKDTLSLYEEGLRSKCLGMLDIANEKVEPWSFKGDISKLSLNTHTVNNMVYPLGTRKYFELSHFEKSIFIGKWSEKNVIVPNEEYADNILNNFDVVENECMIQINISKSVKHMSVGGMASNGSMNVDVQFLDEDGEFYDEVSDKSNRAFLTGEQQGLVSLKLEYTDGSKQFIQTYCSENTYLVEQL